MPERKVSIIYQLKDKTSRGIGKLTKRIKALGSSLFSVKGLFISIFSGAIIKRGLSTVLNAFGKQEDAVKSLNTALKNSGQFTEASSKSLQDYASALQQTTRFGDEEIIKAQSIFLQFGLNERMTKDLTRATLDLAQAKGMSLVQAADLVSKSVGSSTNALSRYGIEITGAVGSTERVNMAVENLGKIFGGQATASATTFSGKIQQMQNAIGDLWERLGKFLAPSLGDASVKIKEFAESLNEEKVQKYVNVLVQFAKNLGTILALVGKVGNALVWLGAKSIEGAKGIQEAIFGAKEIPKRVDLNDFQVQKLAEHQKILEAEKLADEKSKEEELERQRVHDSAMEMLEAGKKERATAKKDQEKEEKIKNDAELKDSEQQKMTFMSLFGQKMIEDETLRKKQSAKVAISGFLGKKSIGIAETIANTYSGATRAFKDFPFPLSFGIAAGILAAGFRNVQAIRGVQVPQAFAQGGIVDGNSYSGDNVLARVNSGEAILNRGQQSNLIDLLSNPAVSENSGGSKEVIIMTDDGEELARGITKKQNELNDRESI